MIAKWKSIYNIGRRHNHASHSYRNRSNFGLWKKFALSQNILDKDKLRLWQCEFCICRIQASNMSDVMDDLDGRPDYDKEAGKRIEISKSISISGRGRGEHVLPPYHEHGWSLWVWVYTPEEKLVRSLWRRSVIEPGGLLSGLLTGSEQPRQDGGNSPERWAGYHPVSWKWGERRSSAHDRSAGRLWEGPDYSLVCLYDPET